MKRTLQIAGLILAAILIFSAGNVSGVLMTADAVSEMEGVGAQAVTNFDSVTASGTVQGEQLTSTDDATIADDASVGGDLTVTGTTSWGCSDTTIDGDLTITGTATAQTGTITGTLTAEQLTSTDDASISDALSAGSAAVGGGYGDTGCSISAAGVLECDGAATFDSTVSTGALTASGATVNGNAAITGTLDVQGGDITLENDETISNSTDGVVQIGGFTAFTEGAVVEATAAGTITPLGSFQPITSGAVITDAVIADGSVAGQLLILTNENASDNITILESGSNLAAGGDIALAGGNDDAVMLLWTGDEWVKVAAFGDN